MGKCEQCIVRQFSSLKALNKELIELNYDSEEIKTIKGKEQLLYEIKGMIKKQKESQ